MNKKNNYIDEAFYNLIAFIKEKNLEEIINIIKINYTYRFNTKNVLYQNIEKYYNTSKLWGELSLENNNFELIFKNAESLYNHIDDYHWLYNNLEDYRSKKILMSILYYWLMLDDEKIKVLIDNSFVQYFDLDLIKCSQNEVFIDVGGYIGDTLINYVNIFGENNYQKIFSYEIVPANIKFIEENIKKYNFKNVIIRNKGAANENAKSFIESDECSSVKKLTSHGEIEVETIKIDDDIKGPITFVKMDIEGGEVEALLGMRKKMKKYKPKLAICLYHNNDHLWQIPKIIHEANPKYKFYLRYYGGSILPTEYILYAI